jgi:D-sedoheptulose 7-phosphate isomerase
LTKHVVDYLDESANIAKKLTYIGAGEIKNIVNQLIEVRNNHGRVFVLGVGGSASNASHFVNDLRKLCHIESYCPTDNVSGLTAITNDIGFEYIFSNYLRTSNFNEKDRIFVFSVGGGSEERHISINLINAVNMLKQFNNPVLGIVGKPDGYTATYNDKNNLEECVVVIPSFIPEHLTPQSEGFGMIVSHCIVSHPQLQKQPTTW